MKERGPNPLKIYVYILGINYFEEITHLKGGILLTEPSQKIIFLKCPRDRHLTPEDRIHVFQDTH